MRTISYGASVLVIDPPIDSVRPSLPTGSTAIPCCDSRAVIVSISASFGTLDRVSLSSVSIPAAIKGNAAFLAPPIWISPARGRPPRILIRSILSEFPDFD